MLKFVCLKSCVNRRVNNGNNMDYEMIGYGSDSLVVGASSPSTPTTDDEVHSWRHSTQMDMLDSFDGPVRSRHVPNFDIYAKTRTLVRQQTVSLIQHGYYDNDAYSHSGSSSSGNSSIESDDSSSSSSSSSSDSSNQHESHPCQIGCSCSFRSATRDSTEIPSSLVTTSTFNSTSSDQFYSALVALECEDKRAALPGVFVCTLEFKSSIEGDLSLKLGDRVVILHTPKEANQYLLVRSLNTQKCGYVPRCCLTPAQQTTTASAPHIV